MSFAYAKLVGLTRQADSTRVCLAPRKGIDYKILVIWFNPYSSNSEPSSHG